MTKWGASELVAQEKMVSLVAHYIYGHVTKSDKDRMQKWEMQKANNLRNNKWSKEMAEGRSGSLQTLQLPATFGLCLDF